MKLIDSIKQDKAALEQHRTIIRIHLSWKAQKKLTMDPPLVDFDPKTSNLSDTFLGCELVTHIDQAEDYVFEDVHGWKISGSGDGLARIR